MLCEKDCGLGALPGDAGSAMRRVLRDIQTGKFAREWILENQANRPDFNRVKVMEAARPVGQAGKGLRSRMSWLQPANY
jgi:ketol-acid reductoisomerase